VNPDGGAKLRATARELHISPELPAGTTAPELRGEAREAPGKSPLSAVLDALDQAIAVTGPGDRPGLMVALAARVAQLGVGLVLPAANWSNGPSDEPERLLTLPQVAEVLGIPEDRAYDLARRRELPVVTIGRYKRVRALAVRDFIGANEQRSLTDTAYVTYSASCDRIRGAANPKALGTYPGSTRRAARGRREQRGPVGARRDGHPPDGGATVAAAGPAGAVKG
jgi:hypothetical protein